MKERYGMPTARDLSSEEMYAKAKERGERLGFKEQFLDNFIERELVMMWKWNNRAKGIERDFRPPLEVSSE